MGATVATATGITLSALSEPLPGAEDLSVEDAVDALAMLTLGGLGVVLLRRRVAVGLGRALVLTATLVGATWLCGGLADVITDGGRPPVVAQLLALASSALYIPAFVLLFDAPLLLFPTGRLPSARWRPVAAVAIVGTALAVLSELVAPGLLDEDVRAWGRNPIGVEGLEGAVSVLQGTGLALVLGSVLAGAAAVALRLLRYRGGRRRQMGWFLLGAVPMVLGMLTDVGPSDVAQVASALVIFGGLIGGMGWALLGAPGRVAERDVAPHDHVPVRYLR
jgi:hypothetical protein